MTRSDPDLVRLMGVPAGFLAFGLPLSFLSNVLWSAVGRVGLADPTGAAPAFSPIWPRSTSGSAAVASIRPVLPGGHHGQEALARYLPKSAPLANGGQGAGNVANPCARHHVHAQIEKDRAERRAAAQHQHKRLGRA